jgi:acetyl esterase/lipase
VNAEANGPLVEVTTDVPYVDGAAPGSCHLLDVAAPTDAVDAPVIVFAHGGAWVGGDKSRAWEPAGGLGGGLARRGAVVFSVNYRIGKRHAWRDQARDLAAAVAWVVQHAADYGGDRLSVFAAGHSSGGQLAAFVALDPALLAPFELEPTDLAGVIGIAGIYDLSVLHSESGPEYDGLRTAVVEPVFGTSPERWAEASPLECVGGAPAPPFLLIAGGLDPLARQMAPFAKRLQAFGVEAETVVVPGADHSTVMADRQGANPVTARRIIRYVDAAGIAV